MIKVLNIISSMDLKQGGPPEVIRNLKKELITKIKLFQFYQWTE